MESDDSHTIRDSLNLIRLYQDSDQVTKAQINAFLICLCGYSFATLMRDQEMRIDEALAHHRETIMKITTLRNLKINI